MPVLVNSNLKTDATGRPLAIRTTVFRAIERTRYEQELRHARARSDQLAAIVSSSKEAIFSTTVDGTILTWNPGAEAMLGYPAKEAVGHQVSDLIFPPDRQAEYAKTLQRLLRGDPQQFDTIRKRCDGTLIEVLASISPIRNEHGTIIALSRILRDNTERNATEQTLAHLAAIVSSSSDAILSQTLNSIVTSWNPGAEHTFGYTAQEMIGQSFLRLIPPERHCEQDNNLAHIKAGECVEHYETVRITKDGRPLDVSVTISPVRDRVGMIVGASKIIRDISRRKQAEEQQKVLLGELAQLNETLEQRIDERTRERDRVWRNSQDLLVVLSADGIIRDANPAWATVLGWDPNEMIGKNHLAFSSPENTAADGTALVHALAGVLKYYENRSLHKDGSTRWIGWHAAPEGGMVYGIGRDITREKQQSEALEHSAARMRSVFETSYLYQGLVSVDGILLETNPASLAGIEARLEDVIGKPFWETPWFAGTPGMPEFIKSSVALVASGKSVHREIILERPTGRRVFDFTLRPVFNATGNIIAMVPEGMELTAMRAAEEQLRHAQKLEALGQLSGGVAHDMNNVLTVVAGNLELVLPKIENASARASIALALDAVEMGAALNRRLMTFAAPRTLAPVRCDLSSHVRDMMGLLARTLGEQFVISHDLAPGLWHTCVDPGEVENALLNLALNARDAMPGGGQLIIETRNIDAASLPNIEHRDFVCLTVTDNGVGMAPDVLSRATEPFFTTKQAGGTGLGLSSVHWFANQSGGHLTIKSQVGKGTTVCIYLPRKPVENPSAGTPKLMNSVPLGNGELILVVDDNDRVREVTLKRIESLGYCVLEANRGSDALRIIESGERVELLLTDIIMPDGMSGLDLVKAVEQSKAKIAIVLASGFAGRPISGDQGVEKYRILAKPYSREFLAHALHDALAAQKPRMG